MVPHGGEVMNKRFVVTPNLCTGCRTCELACSFAHSHQGKPGKSRMVVLPSKHPDLWIPLACLQCEDPACVASCLVGALKLNPETGAVELNQEMCVKCEACVAACPYGCCSVDEQVQMIVKCDLCGGDPVCAHFCPSKALVYKTIEAIKKQSA